MEIIFYIGFYTIWLTPIIFVTSIIAAFKAINNGEEPDKYTALAAISFTFIIVTIVLGIVMSS